MLLLIPAFGKILGFDGTDAPGVTGGILGAIAFFAGIWMMPKKLLPGD